MTSPHRTQKFTIRKSALAVVVSAALLIAWVALLWNLFATSDGEAFVHVSTVAGTKGEFGETFGIAVKGRDIYVSDGQHGKIWRVSGDKTEVFAEGLHTPSSIAFDSEGNLIVADSGTHTIRSVNSSGEVSTIAGVDGKAGFADGETTAALFYAPIGVAVNNNKIYVADAYNESIRVIESGKVKTIAKGFDTPCGIAIWRDKLLITDTGGRKIRVIEPDGSVWTLAGNGDGELKDGLLLSSSFVQPTAIAVDITDSIFIADGNAIRQINIGVISTVRTINDERRGLKDGSIQRARFNRPSGLAFDSSGNLIVADSENRLVRRLSANKYGHEITSDEIVALRGTAEEFRESAPPRWPFDPPDAKRDIAGTLAEIRGEMKDGNDQVWFHNGLDIAGSYGETARFIRDEKVLRPLGVDNFGNLRESLRMPTLGYIHVRVGRDANEKPFDDMRFLFSRTNGKTTQVRVPRGTHFKAGEAIGTLNAMNHVHLIAGRSGSEMNALDALSLPNLTDARPPVIEEVSLMDENWNLVETVSPNQRIKLSKKARIVVKAYDQMDGNSDRRRLGVYRVSWGIRTETSGNNAALAEIKFCRLPSHDALRFVYANGSQSGATGETIFRYVATNSVCDDTMREDFIYPATLESGNYTVNVTVADYFGNSTERRFLIEVNK
jgi:sugar lactone lactonase YvrE